MRVLLCAVFVVGIGISEAHAFHEIESFARTVSGGGNGSYFTGSPRFRGYDCGICHTDAEGQISIGLEVNRGEFLEGRFDLNTGYAFTVRLLGEHRGLESAFNPNTFMLELVDDSGETVGDFLAGPAPVSLVDNRRIIAAEGFGEGETEWSFSWFSPRESPGPLTLYIAMLDGDGAGLTDRRFIDPLNDDVATMELRLCPTGEVCPGPEERKTAESRVACSSSGETGSSWGLALLALAFATRRRKLRP